MKLGGKIKTYPEDFIVEEIWKNDMCDSSGEYTHFALVKRNWDTVKALEAISKEAKCSIRRFGFSGQKDRKAITSQRVSAWRIGIERLRAIKIKDLELKDFCLSRSRINLGSADGNKFIITIRGINRNINDVRRILEEFSKRKRLPNFFGEQRFSRSNDIIGKHIVEGHLQDAVKEILKGEGWIEEKVMAHLNETPYDFAGALRKIPKKILMLYTNAYQARIFNDALRIAIECGKVPEEIEIKPVSSRPMPELNSWGSKRKSFMEIHNFAILEIGSGWAKISFELGSGSYATEVLKELI